MANEKTLHQSYTADRSKLDKLCLNDIHDWFLEEIRLYDTDTISRSEFIGRVVYELEYLSNANYDLKKKNTRLVVQAVKDFLK